MPITLFLGGTRSGKSALAETALAQCHAEHVFYIATAQGLDAAMRQRILRHQRQRPAHWHTLECPRNLAPVVEQALEALPAQHTAALLIDCVTLWMSNILCALPQPESLLFEQQAQQELCALLELAARPRTQWFFVSGETGLGGIGSSPLERTFQDGLGLANQLLAAHSQASYLCLAGKKLLLK